MKFLMLIILLIINMNISADDLDDGINIDEPINDDLKLDVNLQFIKQKATAAAKNDNAGDKVIVNDACGGTGNQTFGAGANLKGATIVNLSNNKGATTVCGQ